MVRLPPLRDVLTRFRCRLGCHGDPLSPSVSPVRRVPDPYPTSRVRHRDATESESESDMEDTPETVQDGRHGVEGETRRAHGLTSPTRSIRLGPTVPPAVVGVPGSPLGLVLTRSRVDLCGRSLCRRFCPPRSTDPAPSIRPPPG